MAIFGQKFTKFLTFHSLKPAEFVNLPQGGRKETQCEYVVVNGDADHKLPALFCGRSTVVSEVFHRRTFRTLDGSELHIVQYTFYVPLGGTNHWVIGVITAHARGS